MSDLGYFFNVYNSVVVSTMTTAYRTETMVITLAGYGTASGKTPGRGNVDVMLRNGAL